VYNLLIKENKPECFKWSDENSFLYNIEITLINSLIKSDQLLDRYLYHIHNTHFDTNIMAVKKKNI
jgi:hypothetical protein